MSEQQTMGKQLAQRMPASSALELDPMKLGEVFAASGWFRDAANPSKAVVKILAGREMGLGPMAAMQGVHIIEGKPSLSANLLATMVKRHPAYDFIPREVTEQGARIEFFQNGEAIGESTFTMADAQRAEIAGKKNFKRYPKAMMFARALSQGVRWFAPDVTAGAPAYVPEELGAEVDEEGEPLSATDSVPAVMPADSAPPVESSAVQGSAEGEREGRDSVATIDADRIDQIINAFGAKQMRYRDINLALGAVGLDGLRANSQKAVAERIGSLTSEQADALEEALHE